MRRALLVATFVAMALAVVLVWRTARRRQPVEPPVPLATMDAGPACREATVVPPPVLPALSAAPLVSEAPGITLRVDGSPVGTSLQEGLRVVEASAPGALSTKLSVKVDPFVPVLLDARVSNGAVTVLVLGARCANCPVAEAEVDVRYRTNVFGDLPDVAKALAEGDWLKGAQSMRAFPPEDRLAPEPARLLAVLYALAGRQTLAREAIATLPKTDPLHGALKRRDAEERAQPKRQLATAIERWNATSDRFQRLTEAFVVDAPELMTDLTWTFDGFSTRFAQAHTAHDAFGGEAALEGASTAFAETVKKLRALHADDCGWQKRVTATF